MDATIIKGLPFVEYAAIKAAHFSTLKLLDLSPLHYQHALGRPDTETASMSLGRLTHRIILEPDMSADVAFFDGVRRGKKWDAFKDANADKVLLRKGDPAVVTALDMRAAVARHPEASRLLREGEGEVSVTWEEFGIACRGRVDWLRPGGIVELKTTRSISPRIFQREIATRLYHVQLAFYSMGLAAAGWVPSELPALIAVENQPPHDVCVYRVGYDALEAGQRKVEAWLKTLAECTATGRWPGVGGDGMVDLRLPDWALADDDMEVNLDGIGG